jgi:hypothetical protein
MQFINNAPFSRSVILVPIIGYWLILNDHFVKQYADLWAELVSRPEGGPAPKPWRLLMTYFGLCLVAAGSAIYHVFCPRELKRYPGATDYVSAIAPHMSRIEEGRLREALAQGDAESKRMNGEIEKLWTIEPVPKNDAEQDARYREMRPEILQSHFDLRNRSWFPVRVAAFALYVAGVLALLVPSANIFYRVVRLLLS